MSAAAPDDTRAHRALGAWHDVSRDRVQKVRRKTSKLATVTRPSRCDESRSTTDAPVAFARQDALGALSIDIRANITLARRVLPRDVGEASATVVVTTRCMVAIFSPAGMTFTSVRRSRVVEATIFIARWMAA